MSGFDEFVRRIHCSHADTDDLLRMAYYGRGCSEEDARLYDAAHDMYAALEAAEEEERLWGEMSFEACKSDSDVEEIIRVWEAAYNKAIGLRKAALEKARRSRDE